MGLQEGASPRREGDLPHRIETEPLDHRLGVGSLVLHSLDDQSIADKGLEQRIVAAECDEGTVGEIPLCQHGWDIWSAPHMESPSQRHSRKWAGSVSLSSRPRYRRRVRNL